MAKVVDKKAAKAQAKASKKELKVKSKAVKKETSKKAPPKPVESDSSDESSDEDDAAPAKDVKVEAKPADSSDDSSESSDDSSSDEEEEEKKPATNGAAKMDVDSDSSDDDSSDDDSSEEEEEKKPKAKEAKKADSDSSSDDDSSDDSSEEEEKEEEPKRKADTKEEPAPKKPRVEAEAAEAEPVSTTVFVGNLPWSATEEELREFFAECGEINSVRIATDAETGRARGFCHIEFATAEATNKAVEYNGTDYGGRAIKVDVSAPRGANGGQRKSFGTTPGAEDGTTVFCKGFDTSEGEDAVRAKLEEVFGECGEIVRVRLPSDRESGELKGFAYLEFADAASKAKAAELDGTEACGGWLKVDVNVAPRTPGGGGGFGGGFGGGRGGGRGGMRIDVGAGSGKKQTFDD